MKFLLILGLILALYFFLTKKIQRFGADAISRKRGSYQLLTTSPAVVRQTFRQAASNAGLGVLLLCIMLLLFAKVKILLFLLPISVFLIMYLPLFTNHLSKTRQQQIWFDSVNGTVYVERIDEKDYHFDLQHQVLKIQKIESVQKTKGLLFGYYRIFTDKEILDIPYLIAYHSPENDRFFEALKKREHIEVIKKFFPFI